MKISGWGKYPTTDAKILKPLTENTLIQQIRNAESPDYIARGLGRSYGDSSLATNVVDMRLFDHFHGFSEEEGLLTCKAGVSLAQIIEVMLPKGWFLPVTPGTKFVTLGGAVASDVHGKNHHSEGSFCDHVESIRIATVSEGVVDCSRSQRPDLFQATCGGMGLTGVILEVTFRLKRVSSAFVRQVTLKAQNLAEALQIFEEYSSWTYSVAWIDCLSTGNLLGRSLVFLGEHSSEGSLSLRKRAKLSVPVDMPGILLNRYSIQAFNAAYYHKARVQSTGAMVHLEPYFYPLDGINSWNRMYGKDGFIQYQFVVPKAEGVEGITAVLERIARSKRGSFLAVLKAFGPGNSNFLSFPIEGYTLALDFKFEPGLLTFLDSLDEVVLSYGGRIYLAKDARMSEHTFKASYGRWKDFLITRKKYQADSLFHSLQSRRLGI